MHTVVLKFVQSDRFATVWTQLSLSGPSSLWWPSSPVTPLVRPMRTTPASSTSARWAGRGASRRLHQRGITIFDKVRDRQRLLNWSWSSWTQLARAQAVTRQVNRLTVRLPLACPACSSSGAVLRAIYHGRLGPGQPGAGGLHGSAAPGLRHRLEHLPAARLLSSILGQCLAGLLLPHHHVPASPMDAGAVYPAGVELVAAAIAMWRWATPGSAGPAPHPPTPPLRRVEGPFHRVGYPPGGPFAGGGGHRAPRPL